MKTFDIMVPLESYLLLVSSYIVHIESESCILFI
jgi:hypothetical protein